MGEITPPTGARAPWGKRPPGQGVKLPATTTPRPHAVREQSQRQAPASRTRARILLVNQHYWPDHASTAQHLTDLAEALAEHGHDVHVLCSRRGSRPGGAPRPRRELHHGVTIHRVGATAFGRGSNIRRMADYLSFHARAALRALTLKRFDVVVTLTTPPLIGVVGTLLQRVKASRHVIWSMDLHPDASLALGKMRRGRKLAAGLQRLSDAIARAADRVVAIGPYMEDRLLAKGVRTGRIATVPVWSRRDEVYPVTRKGHPLRAQLGLSDKFVVMYSGNHGLAHLFDDFMRAAHALRDRDDIAFLFVGDGPRHHEVVAAKRQLSLDNVRLLDFFPRSDLHASLSVADAHLVSLRPEMAGICVPGKLYGAMASGRPVLFVGPAHCEVADTIRDADCGRAFLPGEWERLAETITALADDPQLAAEWGDKGVSAFVADHDRDACCARWCWVLDDLLAGRDIGPTSARDAHRPAASVVIEPPRPLNAAP